MNFNLNNNTSKSKLNLNTKELRLRQDSGNSIKSPVDGVITNVTKDLCDGKVVILFRDNNYRYTVELCGVGNIMKMDGSNVKIGDKIGISQGKPLYIKVFNSQNDKMMLSDLEKKDTEPDKFNSSDSLGRPTLFDVLMGSLYEPFKGPNKKEKIKEDIDRIKSLL